MTAHDLQAGVPLATSPLTFVRPRQHGASLVVADTGSAYRSLAPEAARLILFALEARSRDEFVAAGFNEAMLETALEDGMLLAVGDRSAESASLWEASNWSRAAYALFTQFDLDYAESGWGAESLDEHVDGRRSQILRYMEEEPYPARLWLDSIDEPIELPAPANGSSPLRFDRMFARRSARRFRAGPVDFADFAAVLHGAGANVRAAARSQRAGDPFFVLNSFYSWLAPFAIVQGVEHVPERVYQVDLEQGRLVPVAERPDDRSIASTIAGQAWISGGGFCLFVAVDWLRYMWIYRHARAYINLITQIGEFGQEVIQHAASRGLGGWMTPAVDETRAARLIGAEGSRLDPMYFMKIGAPD